MSSELFVSCAGLMRMADSILCGEYAIKQIDEPFVTEADNKDEWAL